MKKKLLSVFMASALSLSCFTAVPVFSNAAELPDPIPAKDGKPHDRVSNEA